MQKIFADSFYWIALINLNDQWRSTALEASARLVDSRIITTDEILIETLNYFAESGEYFRQTACRDVDRVLLNPSIEIIDAAHESFLDGFNLYKRRLDKGYSLTDCISMNICRKHGIADVLTHDDHFKQEGFNILL